MYVRGQVCIYVRTYGQGVGWLGVLEEKCPPGVRRSYERRGGLVSSSIARPVGLARRRPLLFVAGAGGGT